MHSPKLTRWMAGAQRQAARVSRALAFAFALAAFGQPAAPQPSALPTQGQFPVVLGLPADAATIHHLYNELDFQRACQAYLWALPIVGFAEWQSSAQHVFGAGDTDVVIYETLKDKLGILTANATTPYIGGFPDLSRTGPLVID